MKWMNLGQSVHSSKIGFNIFAYVTFILLEWVVGGSISYASTVPAVTDSTVTASFGMVWHSGTLLGGGLVLLGLLGSITAVIFNWRLRKTRGEFHTKTGVMDSRNRELSTAVESLKDTVERLRTSEQGFRSLSQQLPAGVFLTDLQGECRYVNDCWQHLTGLDVSQGTRVIWINSVHPADRERIQSAWQNALEKSGNFAAEHRLLSTSNQMTWVMTRAAPLRGREGRISGYVGASADISHYKETEESLRLSEARFRSYFVLPLVGIAVTGVNRRWLEVNDRLCEMLGYEHQQLLELSWVELLHPEDLDADQAQQQRVMSRYVDSYTLDERFIRQDGAVLYASVSTHCVRQENGRVEYFVTVVQDITERKLAEEQVLHVAQHDTLMGLPGRALLSDRLNQAVLRAGRDHNLVSVILVDLDRFKLINDTLGHTIGDQLLREVANRLCECVRDCDTVSWQGGDEFAVLLPDMETSEDAIHVSRLILEKMKEAYWLDERELHITCSLGICIFPRDGREAEVLLRNADIALYRAKDMGRNRYEFYESGATQMARDRLDLENSLRHAVDQHELMVFYQPKWNYRVGAITGAEALVRWNHPTRGRLSPAKFIPIAEDSGLVLPLGEWVLRTALREIHQLHQDGFENLRIAVNLSGRQFYHSNLPGLVGGFLKEINFNPSCLELELTESTLMQHSGKNIAILEAFKELGIRLAIDDFGTGYSSLGYLQRFPVDVLKIDRVFVTNLPGSSSDAAIVETIITLAHGLGLEVVAEGIEKPEQRDYLKDHGCDEGQGFLFGRPMPLVDFRELLEKDRARIKTAMGLSAE